MQIIYAFTFNTETKEATFSGNVKPLVALQILQNIVIMAESRAQQGGDGNDKKAPKKVAKAQEGG